MPAIVGTISSSCADGGGVFGEVGYLTELAEIEGPWWSQT